MCRNIHIEKYLIYETENFSFSEIKVDVKFGKKVSGQRSVTPPFNYIAPLSKYTPGGPRHRTEAAPWPRYLGVCGHDRVIPIIIEGGGLSTQRTGPIWIPLNGIVITLWRDLLPIFEPIDLWKGTEIKDVRGAAPSGGLASNDRVACRADLSFHVKVSNKTPEQEIASSVERIGNK